ncbi:hypothetical protein D3C78_1389200 [compost metagenome]
MAIDWKISRPRPGRKNTFSTTMVPASRLANCRPITVTTGIMALRSTWPQSTARWDRPLARAVRTKSSRSTSSTAERVMRARMAACTTASETAGSSRAWSAARTPPPSSSLQPGKPPAENHCNFTENSRISRMANQKLGMAMPSWAKPITPMSPQRLCREAA